MGKSTFTYNGGNNAMSQALLQSTCTAIHNGLIAAGLVQTSDTGQLDFTTIAAPAANDINMGYRMYELIDSLTPTKRFLIRIDFWRVRRRGTATALNEVFPAITAGTASDGAGGLGSDVITVCSAPVTTSSTTFNTGALGVPSYVCAKPGFVNIAIGVGLLVPPDPYR